MSFCRHCKDFLYNVCHLPINNKFILLPMLDILLIAIRCKAGDALPFFHFDLKGAFDFIGNIPRIHLIDEHHHRRCQGNAAVGMQGVIAIGDGNIPHPMGREVFIDIIQPSGAISPQSGKILGHDAIDPPRFDIPHHPPEGRAVKACSRITIIHIFIYDDKALMVRILPQNIPLGFDALAFLGAFVILR